MEKVINLDFTTTEPSFLFGSSDNFWEARMEYDLSMLEEGFIPPKLKKAKNEAIVKAYRMAIGFICAGFSFRVVKKATEKKVNNIFQADTLDEVKQAQKLSISHFQRDGLAAIDKYHVLEEEYLLLGIARKTGMLNKQAKERYSYLSKVVNQIEEIEEDE